MSRAVPQYTAQARILKSGGDTESIYRERPFTRRYPPRKAHNHDLMGQLLALFYHNRDGSFQTQADRRKMLYLIAQDLHTLQYRQLRAQDLGRRHIAKLVTYWKEQHLSDATIANRLVVLRWWAGKIGRDEIMAHSNAAYGLAPRQRVPDASKAQALPHDKLARVKDPSVRLSLELQAAFGFRREEAIKFRVMQADQTTHLTLQGSWCKNGRPREVPIRTQAQRELLERVKDFVEHKHRSLIPADKSYVQQLRRYEYWTARVGLCKMHGLRHAYAQAWFLELTGFPCPLAGGPVWQAMTPEQRELDTDARYIISAELGHGRKAVTDTYLGMSSPY